MYSFAKYKSHYKETLKLALPIIVSQLGYILVQFADNVMVGQYGGEDALPLAAVSFGVTTSLIFFLSSQGLTLGLTPLIGELFAQGDRLRSASYLKHAIWLFSALGAFFVLLQLAFQPMLYHMGQPLEVVDAALPYYRMMAYSLFPVLLFSAFKNFLDGVGNTFVPMVIMMFCNLLNIFLNWVFIYGNLGAPEMGVEGAALATLLSRTVGATLLLWIAHNSARYIHVERLLHYRPDGEIIRSILQIGVPNGIENTMFQFGRLMTASLVSSLGTVAIAANAAALSLANFLH